MATLTWAPTATARRVIFMLTDAAAAGAHIIDFGNHLSRTIAPGVPVVADYHADGVYMAQVFDSDSAVVASTQVTVREAIPAQFAVSAEPGEEYTVQVSFSGEHAAPVRVDFGDGAAPHELWATPDATLSQFVQAGTYTGTVRDLEAKRVRTQQYEVVGPVADPDFSLGEDTSDPDRRTVVLELAAVDAQRGDISVDWGDGSAVETIADPQVGTTVSHEFDPADAPSGDGVFFVLAHYADSAVSPTVKAVTIPFSG